MTDSTQVYQEVLLDHNTKPRNFQEIPYPDRRAEGHNPLCGDRITIYLRLKDGRISEAAFQGQACAICKASASLLTMRVKGQTPSTAQQVHTHFGEVLQYPETDPDPELLEDLEMLSGISQYPARIRCALLPWETLEAALQGIPPTSADQEAARSG